MSQPVSLSSEAFIAKMEALTEKQLGTTHANAERDAVIQDGAQKKRTTDKAGQM